MIYIIIANIIYYLHLFVLIYYVWWFFISHKFFPRFSNTHKIFCIWVLIIQYFLNFICPLTILENYFRKKWDTNFIDDPLFVINVFQKYFDIKINNDDLINFIIMCAIFSLIIFTTNEYIKIKKFIKNYSAFTI